LFCAILSQYVKQLKDHRDLIIKNDKPKKDSNEERLKFLKKQLVKNQQDIKRIQQGYVMEIFTEEEAQEQVKGFKLQRENIELEIEKLQKEKDNTGVDYVDRTIENL